MLLGVTNIQMVHLLSVCQRWRLHFEFVTSVEPIKEPERPTKPDETSTWQGPATVAVETMVWDLPIKIFPANPVHASSVTLLKTVNGICVWFVWTFNSYYHGNRFRNIYHGNWFKKATMETDLEPVTMETGL